MNKKFTNWPDFYHAINLWFNGILIISLAPFAWLFLEMQGKGNTTPLIEMPYLQEIGYVLCAVTFLVTYWQHRTYEYEGKSLGTLQGLSDKINGMFIVLRRNYLRMGALAFLILIAAYITRNYAFVTAYVFVLFLFSLSRPRYDRMLRFIKITKEEEAILANGEEFGQ